ncbi:uncharacterized protein N7482_003806 [Penicillium canariense]|uniref:Uncharacterized protein n=1 Tax=Penicillium canariense TaxID=189055 RepID=A0A9W9IB36_9EURO|nr:uncharacterized protein N7482_003806 [Penicillium canariense]KAJ5168212.1 hypothetical protein N7482_003806 [Penicillium canariense]
MAQVQLPWAFVLALARLTWRLDRRGVWTDESSRHDETKTKNPTNVWTPPRAVPDSVPMSLDLELHKPSPTGRVWDHQKSAPNKRRRSRQSTLCVFGSGPMRRESSGSPRPDWPCALGVQCPFIGALAFTCSALLAIRLVQRCAKHFAWELPSTAISAARTEVVGNTVDVLSQTEDIVLKEHNHHDHGDDDAVALMVLIYLKLTGGSRVDVHCAPQNSEGRAALQLDLEGECPGWDGRIGFRHLDGFEVT